MIVAEPNDLRSSTHSLGSTVGVVDKYFFRLWFDRKFNFLKRILHKNLTSCAKRWLFKKLEDVRLSECCLPFALKTPHDAVSSFENHSRSPTNVVISCVGHASTAIFGSNGCCLHFTLRAPHEAVSSFDNQLCTLTKMMISCVGEISVACISAQTDVAFILRLEHLMKL